MHALSRHHVNESIRREDIGTERSPVVRQDRYPVTEEPCRIIIGATELDVLDYSHLGIAVRGPSPLYEYGECVNCPVIYDGHEISRLNLIRVRSDREEDGSHKVAFRIVGEPLNLERIQGIQEANRLLRVVREELVRAEEIPEAFRLKTQDLHDALQLLESRVAALEKRFEADHVYREELDELEKGTIEVISDWLDETISPKISALSTALADADANQTKRSYEYFRDRVGPLLYQSPFSRRSFTKPLGYAGDYEMMNMLYRTEPLGKTLFARSLHRYIINMPGGKAVRNRGVYLNTQIHRTLKEAPGGRPVKILSVASGPAMEIQMLFKQPLSAPLDHVHFHLLDQDIHSLKYAQRRLHALMSETGHTPTLRLFHQPIKQVITHGLEEMDYDLIYSAGLFDYFSDPVAQLTARRLFAALRPGGRLILGNFNVQCDSRFFMEMALEWNLVYRTEADLKRLFGELGSTLSVESEDLHINLFCVIEKQRPA